ncbi:chemotaxis protein MotB [Modicisalibacter ilicicola DSM 19980]|uniref:Chemotaxis protein MotB n=1 Tax=Modicisalibacter ilicicola DSM 19980 TaxID=1121942 RepID=A0A1M5CMR2_9GAMM|nr:flagellar motor protein MotB [Halomonas ilicicola]SHF55956.1 chemotaxis protein MotB [Halomonas ilicicola DSM 19980]
MSGAHRPIIVKRKKVSKGGHHGGAWKIAYADFMTALMALFLVLWVLSSVSEEELKTIAEYFRTPLPVALAGGEKNTASTSVIPGGGPDPAHINGEEQRVDRREEIRPSDEQRRLINLERRIEAVIESRPRLRELRSQLRMAMTSEGLRIQLVDSERRPMFERGSDRVAPYMRDILRTIAPVLNELPNRISLSGHTDSVPYVNGEKGYSNWELSADRANASRRELVAGGLDSERLLRVAGMGSRVNLEGTEANDATNRRISIVVLDRRAAAMIERQSVRTWPQPAEAVEAPPIPSEEGDVSPSAVSPATVAPAMPFETQLD